MKHNFKENKSINSNRMVSKRNCSDTGQETTTGNYQKPQTEFSSMKFYGIRLLLAAVQVVQNQSQDEYNF